MPAPVRQCTRTSVLALLCVLGACLLSACTLDDVNRALGRGPAPTLEREWVIPGLDQPMDETSTHHWITNHVRRDGVGWGTRYTPAGTSIVDTRTGRTRYLEERDDLQTCMGPDVISPDGLAPLLVEPSTTPRRLMVRSGCTQLAVLDVSTGEIKVVAEDLDLRGLTRKRVLAVDGDVAAIVDTQGRAACRRLDDGAPADNDPACTRLARRLTGTDRPTLLEPDGEVVPVTTRFDHEPDAYEIGRTDDVVLVRVARPEDWVDGEPVNVDIIRAHDLETGETLWQDDDLPRGPHVVDSWVREETYLVAPWGIARVSYEHRDDELLVSSTPMVVTAVDPRTGKDLKEVGRANGALYSRQFGDILVAHTSQDLRLRATISGFRLPTW